MLYLAYYAKVCKAARFLSHWQQVAQYLHMFFFVTSAGQMTFCYFGAKRALDYVIGSIQCVPIPAFNYKKKFGLDVTGFQGVGAVGAVDELYGRPVTPLKSCKRGHSLEALHLYYHFKGLHGERIEEAARENLGIVTSFSLVTWGNFEHILCEYRKFRTCTKDLSQHTVYVTSKRYHGLLPYRG
jgi:hypothetical protein